MLAGLVMSLDVLVDALDGARLRLERRRIERMRRTS
jgi:hypothetical protein